MITCTCAHCKKCQHRQYMRAQRERPAKLDALDLKALAVWQRHRDTPERRDPLASTWRAIEAML